MSWEKHINLWIEVRKQFNAVSIEKIILIGYSLGPMRSVSMVLGQSFSTNHVLVPTEQVLNSIRKWVINLTYIICYTFACLGLIFSFLPFLQSQASQTG